MGDKMRFFSFVALFILSGSNALAQECGPPIKVVAGKFLQAQNDGLLMVWEKSEGVVLFSKEREHVESKKDPEFGGRVLSLTADELGVVESYSIDKCNQHHDRAEIHVRYDVVATTNGEGDLDRTIVPSKKQLEVVYKLISRQGRWYVLDPPRPMVSRVKLTEALNNVARSMDTVLQNPMASQAQKKQYEIYKKELEKLQNLK